MRNLWILAAPAALAVAGTFVTSVAGTPWQEGPPDGADSLFGYAPGEERLYQIGPPDSLMPGESAEWSVRFARTRETENGLEADFEFSHRRFEVLTGSLNAAQEILEIRVDGTATFNRDGFPLQVRFQQQFLNRGERTAQDGRRSVSFVYEPDRKRYRKELAVGKQDWDFNFAIPGYDELDLDSQRGLFLYLPSSLGCIGSARATCVESELAFANPGFLAMVLPYLLEEEKTERDFLFFMPSSIGATPFRPVIGGRWLSRERNNLGNQKRYFERWKLKLGESEEIEVGPRKMHAWRLEMGGGIDRIWIEPGGRVLRIDLETTMGNADKRYIRLVFPFEDFVSPNPDPAEKCCR